MSTTNPHMNMSRRGFLQIAGTASALLLLPACAAPAAPGAAPAAGGDAASPTTEKTSVIATTQMAITQWDPTLERAKDALPDVDLTINQIVIAGGGWSAYSDQVVTTIAGGEQMDVIMIAVEGIRLLAARNILSPLDDFFAADSEANDVLQKDVHETLRGMLQVDGKQMEYPFSWNNMVLYYNTAIFKDKGVDTPTDLTWDSFLETSQKIANVTGGADDLYAYSFWGNSMFGMHAWFFNNDTGVLTDDWADSNMMDPKVSETLQYMADLILKHKVAPNPTGWDEWPQFHGGHLAMRTCGRWCISGSMNEHFDTYDLVYQPHASGDTRTVAGTDGWGISTSTANKDQAWEVVKLLSGTEASVDMVKTGGNIPALRSVAEMPVFAEFGPTNTAIFYSSLDHAKTVPSPTNFNIIEPLLNRYYASIWNGESTVEEAVAAAHTELQAEMDKLKA